MAGFLTAVGTGSYNGFQFPDAIETQIRIVPQPDQAGRITKYNEYQMVIEFIVYPGVDSTAAGVNAPRFLAGVSVDDGIEALRRILTTPCKGLIYQGTGMGTSFSINTLRQDVAYGPKPRILSLEPIGSTFAWRCVWTVSVMTVDCTCIQDSAQIRGILAYNFGASWRIMPNGLTQRVISGYIEIAGNRNADGIPTDIADAYRERLRIPVPVGFERVQDFDLNYDKRNLAFRIVDEEIPSPNAYFPGCIKMDVEYNVVGGREKAFTQWSLQLDGTIEVAPGNHPSIGWIAFLQLYKQKKAQAVKAKVFGGDFQDLAQFNGTSLLTRRVRLSERPFSYSNSFSIEWILYTSPQTLIEASGIFLPTETNWEAWHKSLLINQGPRGTAGMKMGTAEDRIVDICNQSLPTILAQPTKKTPAPTQDIFLDKCPADNKASWVRWDSKARFYKEASAVTHAPLGTPDQEQQLPAPDDNSITVATVQVAPNAQIKTYYRGGSKYFVHLVGSGARVCYTFSPPTLQALGTQGAKVVEISKDFIVGIDKSKSLPIFWGVWSILYEVTNAPIGDLTVNTKWTGASKIGS